jgi:hypothetical protein
MAYNRLIYILIKEEDIITYVSRIDTGTDFLE